VLNLGRKSEASLTTVSKNRARKRRTLEFLPVKIM